MATGFCKAVQRKDDYIGDLGDLGSDLRNDSIFCGVADARENVSGRLSAQ